MWRDVVFVNLSGLAPEFSIARREKVGGFEQPIFGGRADGSLPLGWIKTGGERYCDYRCAAPSGLNSYSRLEDHYNILDDGYAGQAHVFKHSDNEAKFPAFEAWQNGIPAEYCF